MRYLPNGTWMQKADRYTIEKIGIPSLVLMEHAACEMIEVLEEEKFDCSDTLIVCGSGNNGGDGFAIARLLYRQGNGVTVLFAGKEKSMSEECKTQADIVRNLGIPIVTELPEREYTVVIDAVFGVGLNRKIEGHYQQLLEWMNRKSGRKAAVDIPSGVNAANGQIFGIAFQAELTVSFQCEKLGTVLFPGKDYAGKVVPVDIGIDTDFMQEVQEICYTLDPEDIGKRLPERKADSHKGSYGKVLMITGSDGMAGAAFLSAKAAYVSGAGLVRIYTPESNRMILQQLLPEAIISVYTDYAESELEQLLKWADVVCIGCGFGQSRISEKILHAVMEMCTVPCVIDADGINLLTCNRDLLRKADMPIVLTPHMKEMSGMLGCSVSELKEDRFTRLLQFTGQYPAVCVLKDTRTVVAERTKAFFVNTAGNSSMAKAGAGDVLAGVIAGLLAGHLDVYDAAVLGVYLHACGGDLAKEALGSYGGLAKDLITGIGRRIKEAEEKRG